MRKCLLLIAALAFAYLDVAGLDSARAQMGFGGFGGGGFGFGGGNGFGRGGYGGGGAYGGRGFGQGGFGQGGAGRGGLGRGGSGRGDLGRGGMGRDAVGRGGIGRRDAGGTASTARGSRATRDAGARADRTGAGRGGARTDQRAYRPPPRVVTYPRPRPPGFRPPIVVVAPPPPPAGVAPPNEPPRLLATPAPAGAGSPPPARAPAAFADRNFSIPAPDERRYVPNEIVVATAADVPPARLQQVESRLGLTPLASARIKLLDVDVRRYRLSDNASVRGTVQALQGNADVRAAQPNYLFELQDDEHASEMVVTKVEGVEAPMKPAATVEPTRLAQYAIEAMKLEGAHKLAEGDAVLIAVIDTGLDETHPEIAGTVADRFDAVGGTYRAHSHGTAMGGVIVAHKDLVGIAPKARLLAIRAFDRVASGSGQGTTYDILRGLDFAADHKAQVINMSFAGPRDELLCEALAKARALGMIEIAAAGNAGPDAAPLYPAAEPGVIAITATDTHDKLFAMANRGGYVAAAAPGVDVLAPGVGGAVQLSSGTSIAAAEASGVVALLLQAHPGIATDDVRKILSATARQVPADTGQPTQVIDALAAIEATGGGNPDLQRKGGAPAQAEAEPATPH